MSKPPLSIAITGGAGQIGYQLLFYAASGQLFGYDQPIALRALELPDVLPALQGVKMELQDCAFPLLQSIEIFSDPFQAFKEIDYAILSGAKPRVAGMERKALLLENGKFFVEQGKALNEVANNTVKIFVVGNPCNTNCLIAMNHAPRLCRKNFYAMTRLDQNRATFFLSQKANVSVRDVSRMTIWGNHSSTQVPDFFHARIGSRSADLVIQDRQWLENEFFELVQKRGSAIIQARGKSSAASASHALLDALKDTLHPTREGCWFSSAIDSTGNPYGIEDNLVFSFPCRMNENKEIEIIQGLDIHEFLQMKIKATERELVEERDLVRSIII